MRRRKGVPSRAAPSLKAPSLKASVSAALASTLGLALAHADWPPPAALEASELRNPEYWPDDPAYGYRASSRPEERATGQWQHYSFTPERTPGAPPLRQGEAASGMSVDAAWRTTIGSPKVTLAVIDVGVAWHEPDLVEQARLNLGELRSMPPLHADGSACAPLDPAMPAQDLVDCNGDGVFSVADYREHPGLVPEGSETRPAGDANQNGVLDPGDLMLQPGLVDGVDNDNNGYVDDLCGWDFFGNDRDALDTTNFGSGTNQAKDSVAETDNGVGGAGVCPKCQFLPLRVGDRNVADPQKVAEAILYAADNGANVVQLGVRTLGASRFLRSAIDYAYARGVLVVAPMGNENARHATPLATSNHVLPVHAITMLGRDQESTSTPSFLAFNPCSNFGAQGFLSASGTGCSEEAVGRLAGVAGLLVAASLDAGYGEDPVAGEPALSAGELFQLLTMTADDVDVVESRQPNSDHFWSQRGFDQRFGYGRVNADTAVRFVSEARIPPEVDITRPRWFRVLYADRLTAPVQIFGTVSAKRADSFDYRVEWAPGVQPLDSDYRLIKREDKLPPTRIAGGETGVLAELDVRDIDVSHVRDPDSPRGENDATITLRVRALSRYVGAGPNGSDLTVPGELRRAFFVTRDPDLLPGFPLELPGSVEASPKLADIDGDGVRDLVLASADGTLDVFSVASGEPRAVTGFPVFMPQLASLGGGGAADHRAAPAYAEGALGTELARESIVATPAIADLDGDRSLDIVVATLSGTLVAVDRGGRPLEGWPVRLPNVPECVPLGSTPCASPTSPLSRGAVASPVIADIDGDGALEVVQAALDGYVHVFRRNGEPYPGFPVRVHFPGSEAREMNGIVATPALCDFNDDGILDILVGSSERLGQSGQGENSGAVYLIDGRGNQLENPLFENWPVTVTTSSKYPLLGEGVSGSPVCGDLDGDGQPEAIFYGNGSVPHIVPANPGTQSSLGGPSSNELPVRDGERGLEPTNQFGPSSNAAMPDTMLPFWSHPALGDLNQDGTPDVIAAGSSLTLIQALGDNVVRGGLNQQLLSMWNGESGRMFPASPVLMEGYSLRNSQAVADLTGDGYPEVITGSSGYFVHAVDACGNRPAGFPKFTGQWIASTPAVGDIDGDRRLEVVVATRGGWVYAYRTQGRQDGVIAWESFHHDNRNTGSLETRLEQGRPLGESGPLELDDTGRCLPVEPSAPPEAGPELRAAGGCGCKLAIPRTNGSALPLLVALLTLFARRMIAGAGCRRSDLNRRPRAYEARALTG